MSDTLDAAIAAAAVKNAFVAGQPANVALVAALQSAKIALTAQNTAAESVMTGTVIASASDLAAVIAAAGTLAQGTAALAYVEGVQSS